MKNKLIYASNSIIPSRWANSVHVMKMCNALFPEVDDVELLSPNVNDYNGEDGNCFNYYGVKNRFNIIRLPYYKFLPGRISNVIYSLCCFVYMLKNKPSKIYGRNIISISLASLLFRYIALELHAPVSKFSFAERIIFKFAVRFSSSLKVVTISKALKDMVLNENSSMVESQVYVLHDAADIPVPSNACVDLKGAGTGLNIGYIGHLYPGRGIDVIVSLAEKHQYHNFHVVGGNDECLRYWEGNCNLDNVFFYGHVSPKQTEAYRESFDVLLAPYQNEVSIAGKGNTSDYMSPLKIFEYMSSRKPIICSDIPVLREVLNSSNSILVKPDNISEWSGAIISLEEKDRREVISEQAFLDFLSDYTWTVRARKINDILS